MQIENGMTENISVLQSEMLTLLTENEYAEFYDGLHAHILVLECRLLLDKKKKKLECDLKDFSKDNVFSWPREFRGPREPIAESRLNDPRNIHQLRGSQMANTSKRACGMKR